MHFIVNKLTITLTSANCDLDLETLRFVRNTLFTPKEHICYLKGMVSGLS